MKTILLTFCAVFIVSVAHAQNPSVYIEDGQYKFANFPKHYTVRYAAVDDDDNFYVVLKNTSVPLAEKEDSCRFFYGEQNHLKEDAIIARIPGYSTFDVRTKDFSISLPRTVGGTSSFEDTEVKTFYVNE